MYQFDFENLALQVKLFNRKLTIAMTQYLERYPQVNYTFTWNESSCQKRLQDLKHVGSIVPGTQCPGNSVHYILSFTPIATS
jgi:hypothetical protein